MHAFSHCAKRRAGLHTFLIERVDEPGRSLMVMQPHGPSHLPRGKIVDGDWAYYALAEDWALQV